MQVHNFIGAAVIFLEMARRFSSRTRNKKTAKME
jgi:hypothetical protein